MGILPAASTRKLTNTNHIRSILRDFFNFVVELIEDFIILFTVISRIEWLNVSLLLLLEPGIGISNITNYACYQLL
jgi:hypothetical protein